MSHTSLPYLVGSCVLCLCVYSIVISEVVVGWRMQCDLQSVRDERHCARVGNLGLEVRFYDEGVFSCVTAAG